MTKQDVAKDTDGRELRQSYGELLRKLRIRTQFKIVELAAAVKLGPSTLRGYEHGRSGCPKGILHRALRDWFYKRYGEEDEDVLKLDEVYQHLFERAESRTNKNRRPDEDGSTDRGNAEVELAPDDTVLTGHAPDAGTLQEDKSDDAPEQIPLSFPERSPLESWFTEGRASPDRREGDQHAPRGEQDSARRPNRVSQPTSSAERLELPAKLLSGREQPERSKRDKRSQWAFTPGRVLRDGTSVPSSRAATPRA
ncbi:MAG TPA: helix-turn-helix transcriptional regulator [Ktedonobacterales bacterium]|jgi:transcriptional regulator with XRE-family HTH domain